MNFYFDEDVFRNNGVFDFRNFKVEFIVRD
jgi:hypothetical protein